MSLSDGKDQYVAGTHFNDTFVGENNRQRILFCWSELGGRTRAFDTFTGGQFGSNIAVFPDAISNYTISARASQTVR